MTSSKKNSRRWTKRWLRGEFDKSEFKKKDRELGEFEDDQSD